MVSGLSTAQADAYHQAHGYNEIAEHRRSLFERVLKHALSPITGMLLLASLLSYASDKTFDGSFILLLLVLNVGIAVAQEFKADSAIEKLNEHLAIVVKVFRDGVWQTLPARSLAPGDLLELRSGGVIPADGRVLTGTSASVSEAALTGESLPKEKKPGEPLYSGSFVASGLLTAEVTAIGSNTSFGKTLAKSDVPQGRSTLERDILRITRFLSLLSLCAVLLLTAFFALRHAPLLEVVRLDLSLVIAGIPVSLPTVMTLIIALGVIALAQKKVVVRRLAALEELANTDFLLTDKTGTLTKNHIVVSEVASYGKSEEDVRRLAALVAAQEPDIMLNKALLEGREAAPVQVCAYIPADSARKRSTLTFRGGGQTQTLALGAPQVIEALCDLRLEVRAQFEAVVARFAAHGYRTLALAAVAGSAEEHMELVGAFALSDELRGDALSVVHFLHDNGIGVAMVTGDNRAIAAEIAHKLKLPGSKIVTREELLAQGWEHVTARTLQETQAFAEILPEDKLALIERARQFYTVAANGDGVNDLPAVRAANVGFAVANAVDALKGAADIVLLSEGIGVMRDAFIEGRKIFARLYTYSLYRISESFRLICTIVILGLATGTYPLSPLQLILLALLNDIPIISLATDRVKIATRPSHINVRAQFMQSVLYGSVGVLNSMLLYGVAVYYWHLPLPVVETLFFLKLTVSGHLLIYVAHTGERWWRYFPSTQVIVATSATQALATALALGGVLMPAALSWQLALFVWVWSGVFMQVSEMVKRRRK